MPASALEEPMACEAEDRPSSPLEVHRFHVLRSGFITGYILVIVTAYALFRILPPVTEAGKLVYLFGMLVGPSAVLMLLLHIYEIRGMVKTGDHAIPLTLDFTYFGFVIISALTFIGLWRLFLVYDTNAHAFTLAWFGTAILLCGELLGSMIAARLVVHRFIAPHLPSFFETGEHNKFRRPRDRPQGLHRNIPNWSIWEQEESFTRIKRV